MSAQDHHSDGGLAAVRHGRLSPTSEQNRLVIRGLVDLREAEHASDELSSSPLPEDRAIEFPSDDGPVTVSILVTRVGDRLFRLEEIPLDLFGPIKSANYLDVIEVDETPVEGSFRFVRVVELSGCRAFGPYYLSSPTIVEGGMGQPLLQRLIDDGGMWATVFGGLLYISLPPGAIGDPLQWVPNTDHLDEAMRLDQ